MSNPRANHRPLIFPAPAGIGPAGEAERALPPASLPVPLTPFLGRQTVVAALAALLRQAVIRLLTLTGPGGVGKTRLAIQVARECLPDYADGVVFVDLAPLTDPALVLPALGQAIGVAQGGRQPLADQLAEHLRTRRLLLVLDNFEQVVAAGPAVSALLEAAPGVQALVTSRVPLGCYGEQEFPVPPLTLPAAEVTWPAAPLAEVEAVQFFVARARAIHPAFTLTDENAAAVAAICRRLDGLPLALELAAARTRLFAPAALLTRLERRLPLLTGGAANRPARQQTLRAALAWSYDLLEGDTQALFARLGVFAGGATLDAVIALAAPLGLAPDALLDTLELLVAQNLLTGRPGVNPAAPQVGTAAGEIRFVMLETIREYAGEQLAARGEMAAAQADHATYFLALAEQFAAAVRGPEQSAAGGGVDESGADDPHSR